MSTIHRVSLIFGIATTVLSASRLECNATDFVGTLHCANGDAIPGRLSSADGETLCWQSPLFKELLTLAMPNLNAVVFERSVGHRRATESYRVVLRNGNVLHGEIKDVNEQHVVLASARHGQLAIDRSVVRSLRRMDDPSVICDGPIGLAGWRILEETCTIADLIANDAGHLSTTRPFAELFCPLSMPDQAAIEVTLRTDSELAFSLAFTDRPSETIRVETWDRELVMTVGHEFEPIATLNKHDSQELQLRLHWDRKSGTLAAYSKDGSKMATIARPPSMDKSRPGFYIQNKGSDLTLARLHVTRWTGEFPREADDGKNYIRLADGRTIYGRMTGFDAQQQEFDLETKSGKQQIAANDVDSVYVVDETNKPDDKPEHKLVYFDGTRLTGVVTSMADGSATIRTTYCAEPIKSALRGIARLSILNPVEKSEDSSYRLYCDGHVFQGNLVGDDDSDGVVCWQPVGGVGSSPLARKGEAHFVRVGAVGLKPLDPKLFSDTLFLTNRDTIPCRIDTIDKDSVHIQTAFTDTVKIPCEHVKAIELGKALWRSGFGDVGWHTVASQPRSSRPAVEPPGRPRKGEQPSPATEQGDVEQGDVEQGDTVQWDAEKVVFTGPGIFGHDLMMHCNEIQFDLTWNPTENAGLTIGLLGDSAEAPPIPVRISCLGNIVEVWRFWRNIRPIVVPEEGTARFKVRIENGRFRITVNNQLAYSAPYDPRQYGGRGITFSQERKRWREFTISGFEAGQSTGTFVPCSVDQESKRQVLTVPRFSKKSPPKHILIAGNGDLLRGHLSSLDDKSLTFVSRRDEFTVSRGRVAAIVWLHGDEVPVPSADNTEDPFARIVLCDGSRVVMTLESMDEQSLIGTSTSLGRCKMSLDSIRELHVGGYAKSCPVGAYADWKLLPATEPRFPDAEGVKAAPGTTLVGQPAKDFEASLLDGGTFRLSSHADKIVVLDFWATWSGSCIRAMPEYIKVVQSLDKNYDKDKIMFVSVNQGESPNTVRECLKRHSWKRAIAMDVDQQIGAQFQVSALPHFLIIGKGGMIEGVHVGFNRETPQKLNTIIRRMLAKEAVVKVPTTSDVDGTDVDGTDVDAVDAPALLFSAGQATELPSREQALEDDRQRQARLLSLQEFVGPQRAASRRQMKECLDTIVRVCKPSDEQISRLRIAGNGAIWHVRKQREEQVAMAIRIIRENDVCTGNGAFLNNRHASHYIPAPFSCPIWKKALDSVLTPKQRAAYTACIEKEMAYQGKQAVEAVSAALTAKLSLSKEQAGAVREIVAPVVVDHIRLQVSEAKVKARRSPPSLCITWFHLQTIPPKQLQSVLNDDQWKQWQAAVNQTERMSEELHGSSAVSQVWWDAVNRFQARGALKGRMRNEPKGEDKKGNIKLAPKEPLGRSPR